MARDDTQVNVRLPAELVERLRDVASRSGKSLTSEIVDRLVDSFPATIHDIALDALRREAELLSAHHFRLKFDARARYGAGSPEQKAHAEELRSVEQRLQVLEHQISERRHKFNKAWQAKKAKASSD